MHSSANFPVAMDTSALVPSLNKGPPSRNMMSLYNTSGGGGGSRKDVVRSGGVAPARTSSLLSPIMALSGHEGEILTTK